MLCYFLFRVLIAIVLWHHITYCTYTPASKRSRSIRSTSKTCFWFEPIRRVQSENGQRSHSLCSRSIGAWRSVQRGGGTDTSWWAVLGRGTRDRGFVTSCWAVLGRGARDSRWEFRTGLKDTGRRADLGWDDRGRQRKTRWGITDNGRWDNGGERSPRLRVGHLFSDPQERWSPRQMACYLLSDPRERYSRQTLHPLLLIEHRRGSTRRKLCWLRKDLLLSAYITVLIRTGKRQLQTFVIFSQKPQPRKIPAVGCCEDLCRHKTSKAVL